MSQKKKNKKTHKKSHVNKNHEKMIYQTIPNYSSSQFTGHQNNHNVPFGPQPQQESRTDNLVGDLIGKLIGKIENDGNKQTQEYTKEIQPINNNNNVNIYNSVPGTTTTETKTETTGSNIGESIADAVKEGIKGTTRSAGDDFAIQTAAGAASLIGIGGLGVAYNSNMSSKAKLKVKKVGGGLLGAVTSGAGALGTAISNNILKRGTKLGGDKTTNNVMSGGGKLFEKKGKPGTYARLEDEMNPSQKDFDNFISKPSTITTPTPTPTSTPIKTPVRSINLFTPARSLTSFKPQNMFSPATPLNLLTTPKPMYIEPVETTLKKMNAGEKIASRMKMKTDREKYIDFREVNREATKIQRVFRTHSAKNTRNQPIEVMSTVQPARLSGVHERTRQGATNTRVFERNQALERLVQPKPTRPSSGTEMSRATTAAPQPRQYFTSDNPEYRRGQKARAKDGDKSRHIVEVLNPDNPYNQGYFGDALHQGKEGRHPREVKQGRPRT